LTRYRVSLEADADLRKIAAYSEKQWGQQQSNAYIQGLFDAFKRLSDVPEIAQRVDIVREGYRKFPQGSHIIFFHESDNRQIEIVRVLHKRMDLEWRIDPD